VALLAGCGGKANLTQSFMRENASLAYIKTVAVLPFEGGDRAPRIRELTATQLLALDLVDVVDKGRVDSFLEREAIEPDAPLDTLTIKRMGEALKVDAILRGSVEALERTRGNAAYQEMIITLRLIDTETGTLLWQASGRGSGYSLADRLFGFAPKDSFSVTLELLEALFATMR
jgi:TolB-like protein